MISSVLFRSSEVIDQEDDQNDQNAEHDNRQEGRIINLNFIYSRIEQITPDEPQIIEDEPERNPGEQEIRAIIFLAEQEQERGDQQQEQAIIKMMEFKIQEDRIGIMDEDKQADNGDRQKHDRNER